MPSLLSIPEELRQKTLDLVVNSADSPPDGPSTACQHATFEDIYNAHERGLRYVKHVSEKAAYVPSASALLRTHRTLADDTRAILARTKINYTLDIMLVNEQELWPTWTSVPLHSTQIETVSHSALSVSCGLFFRHRSSNAVPGNWSVGSTLLLLLCPYVIGLVLITFCFCLPTACGLPQLISTLLRFCQYVPVFISSSISVLFLPRIWFVLPRGIRC